MVNKKKFKKVVKYDWDTDYSVIILWPFLLLLAITFPLWYWLTVREVHWEEIKHDAKRGN